MKMHDFTAVFAAAGILLTGCADTSSADSRPQITEPTVLISTITTAETAQTTSDAPAETTVTTAPFAESQTVDCGALGCTLPVSADPKYDRDYVQKCLAAAGKLNGDTKKAICDCLKTFGIWAVGYEQEQLGDKFDSARKSPEITADTPLVSLWRYFSPEALVIADPEDGFDAVFHLTGKLKWDTEPGMYGVIENGKFVKTSASLRQLKNAFDITVRIGGNTESSKQEENQMDEATIYCKKLGCEITVEAADGVSRAYIRRCTDMIENMSDAMLDEICEAAKRFCLAFIRVEKDAMGDEYQETEPYHRINKDTPARELLALIRFDSLDIDETENENQLYFRLSGNSDWEIEHGLEADFLDGALFYLGDYEEVSADSEYYCTGEGAQWNYALTEEQLTAGILAKIEGIADLWSAGGVSDTEIDEAEQTLQLLFPTEYRAILRKYGCIDFFGHEWTGLGIDGECNVVNMTQRERELTESLAAKFFVLENAGIDGIIIAANEYGDVFQCQGGQSKKIHDSILEYLDWCLRDSTSH